ncbi:MAG: prepilin-type N-terminal cleavage/methylation domain-containing protein [Verrucomicrobium sp.]|nr:prepilin-type N-terminal cleavage/methylation domain-containing protein [Verrucomicrobium sp.]
MRAKRAFTLLEILLVLALTALVAGMTLVSVQGAGGAQRLAVGGNLIVDLAQKARQESITRGTLTALVLVTGSGRPEWDYRLWTILELQASAAADGEPEWVPASPWRMLSEGVLVDPAQSGSFLLNPPSLAAALPPLRYGGEAIAPGALSYVIFQPTGSLYLASAAEAPAPPGLRLVLGRMLRDSGRDRLVYGDARPGAAGPANYYQITFNSYTGLPIVDRP